MKYIIILLSAIGWTFSAYSQTNIQKEIPVENVSKLQFDFKWPDLIKFESYEGNTVMITGTVSINKGQNDKNFVIKSEKSGNALRISSFIENFDELPKKIVIKKGDEEYFFNTADENSPEIQAFKKEHGSDGYQYMNHGVIKTIQLVIKVPKHKVLDIASEFGTVELAGVSNELKAYSKFGGVDVRLPNQACTVKAGTRFGQKYTDLEDGFETIQYGDHPGKWDLVTAKIKGGGIAQEFRSEFGNVYLRKN